MRRGLSLIGCVLIISAHLLAQDVSVPTTSKASTSTEALALASAAYSAISAGIQVSDETLNGTITWQPGVNQNTGVARAEFKGVNESLFDLTFGSHHRIEVWTGASQGVVEGEVISDGNSRSIVPHNCWVPPVWFSPLPLLASMVQPSTTLTYIGPEVRNGNSVDHLQAILSHGAASAPPKLTALIAHLSTVDIYLDRATHLPWAVLYKTHPDNDLKEDIPVEIRFADYRSVNGVTIPFRIQRLINNELNLDFTISDAVINTGLADAAFALQ